MLIENATDPLRIREGEHVPTIRRRPIGNAQAGLSAGNQAAYENEKTCAAGCEQGESMKGNVCTHLSVGLL